MLMKVAVMLWMLVGVAIGSVRHDGLDLEDVDAGAMGYLDGEGRPEDERGWDQKERISSPVLGIFDLSSLGAGNEQMLWIVPMLITLTVWLLILCAECCCYKDSEYTLFETAVIALGQRQIIMNERDEVAEEKERVERATAKRRHGRSALDGSTKKRHSRRSSSARRGSKRGSKSRGSGSRHRGSSPEANRPGSGSHRNSRPSPQAQRPSPPHAKSK